ncbi:MAG: hypothetical protein AB1583_02995 [Bacteroidota bacterium]|jgi:hypothetical protein
MLIHENPLMDRENSGQVMSVDLGVKTGIAVFSSEGRLRWFGSRNYGSINSLRNDLPRLLHSHAPLRVLVLEGGGVLENVWMREAHYRNIAVVSFHAGHWRQLFFGSDPLMHTNRAKMKAVDLARAVIGLIGENRASLPIHHAAEAILTGLCFLYEEGKVELPVEIHRLFRYPRSK